MNVRVGLGFLGVLFAAASVVTGCGRTGETAAQPVSGAVASTTSPAPPATGSGPSGFRQISDPAGGFTVAVPIGWQELNLDSPGVADAVARLLARDPAAAAQIGSVQQLSAAGVRLLALGSGGTQAVNVVVRQAPLLAGGSIDSLLAGVRSEVTGAGGSLLRQTDATLGGVPSLRVTVTLPVGGRPVTSEQCYAVDRGEVVRPHHPSPGHYCGGRGGLVRLHRAVGIAL